MVFSLVFFPVSVQPKVCGRVQVEPSRLCASSDLSVVSSPVILKMRTVTLRCAQYTTAHPADLLSSSADIPTVSEQAYTVAVI